MRIIIAAGRKRARAEFARVTADSGVLDHVIVERRVQLKRFVAVLVEWR